MGHQHRATGRKTSDNKEECRAKQNGIEPWPGSGIRIWGTETGHCDCWHGWIAAPRRNFQIRKIAFLFLFVAMLPFAVLHGFLVERRWAQCQLPASHNQ